MRRMAKILLGILGALIAMPVIYILVYDLAVFQPQTSEVSNLLEIAAQDERSPSPLVARVIRAGVPQHLSASVSRMLLQRSSIEPKSQREWHFTSALWWVLVALHFSDQEQTTLFLSLSYMGNGVTGFAAASQALFGAPLNSLSLEQVATLAVITRAPAAFLESPERLARVRTALVKRVQDGI